jgi:hypothetical protein
MAWRPEWSTFAQSTVEPHEEDVRRHLRAYFRRVQDARKADEVGTMPGTFLLRSETRNLNTPFLVLRAVMLARARPVLPRQPQQGALRPERR